MGELTAGSPSVSAAVSIGRLPSALASPCAAAAGDDSTGRAAAHPAGRRKILQFDASRGHPRDGREVAPGPQHPSTRGGSPIFGSELGVHREGAPRAKSSVVSVGVSVLAAQGPRAERAPGGRRYWWAFVDRRSDLPQPYRSDACRALYRSVYRWHGRQVGGDRTEGVDHLVSRCAEHTAPCGASDLSKES